MKSASRAIHDAYARFLTRDSNALGMSIADLRSMVGMRKESSLPEIRRAVGELTARGVSTPPSGSNDRAILEACEHAFVISTVESLNPVARALAMYVHAPDCEEYALQSTDQLIKDYAFAFALGEVGPADLTSLQIAALGIGRFDLSDLPVQYGRCLKVMFVTNAAIENYKALANSGGKRTKYTPEQIGRLIGVTEEAYERDYRAVADRAYDALDRVDRYVLTTVASLLKEKEEPAG